ncbi:MAG: tRNA (adenosine(37)-N6)-threonylcarbamoyltransferase complex dimerization subunit type 1 TsaB [Solirubrobacteraceae bacterium]
MRVLAFDTATAATAVAILDGDSGASVETREDPIPGERPGHAQRLLGLIREALDAMPGPGWAGIDRIAVGTGPGTFTGMRIGIATAQALARATGIPLVGVSTLASLELGARTPARSERAVLAVIDARRGEAFVAGGGIAPQVLTPEALAELTGQRTSERVLAVGDGALRYRDVLEAAGAEVPPDGSPRHRVSALNHCRLALDASPGAAVLLAPQYLRAPDAERSARR